MGVMGGDTMTKKTIMDRLNNEGMLSIEEAIKEKLEGLKCKVTELHEDLLCLKECSRLSNLLHKLYEIREGLNQLERGLLQSHLRCCISPGIKVPGDAVLAVSNLSARHHGAILVIEREDNVDAYLNGGVIIDAPVSAPILENILYPGSPLHDGAVIIRNGHIRKASCLLPLAPHAPGLENLGLGTRHRAAIGLSQVSDALVIVVSEEKGWISLALRGQLYPNLGTFALLQKLGNTMEKDKGGE
jgi:diadenylate cyclase